MGREGNIKEMSKEIQKLNSVFEEGRILMFDFYRDLDPMYLQNMARVWQYGAGSFLYEDGKKKADTSLGVRAARRIEIIQDGNYKRMDTFYKLIHAGRKELIKLGWRKHKVYDAESWEYSVSEHIVFVREEYDKRYLGLRRKGVSVCEIMKSFVWENIQERPDKVTAIAHVMDRNELDFELYDVVTDCINPITGKSLVNFTDSSLDRYYAFRNNEIDYDADSSLEANIIYEKVFLFVNRLDKKVIRPQKDYDGRYNRFGLKFELGEHGCTGGLSYRGDTMNSVATTNKAYYWSHKEIHGDKFIWPREALKLMDIYHTPGNFMVLPYRNGFSINQARGTGNSKDYFDLFLLAIYNYFLQMNGVDGDYRVSLDYVLKYNNKLVMFMTDYLRPFIKDDRCRFSEHDSQLIDDIADTSMMISNIIPGWEAFIEDNLLQDFVEQNEFGRCGRPKELWRNHFTTFEKNYGVPYKEEQFIEFWTGATDMIEKRSRRIYEALHLHEQDKDYCELVIFN